MKQIRHFFNIIDEKTNKYWVPLFLCGALYLTLKLLFSAYHHSQQWNLYHVNIFIVSFLYFFAMVLGCKIRPLLFIGLLGIDIIIGLDDWIESLANWTFFSSPFKDLFNNIAAKDSNVFLILCFCILGIMSLCKLIYLKTYRKRWSFQLIFTCLTIFSFIFITFIFHYVLIEKYFRTMINNEMQHVQSVYKIDNESDFNKACNLEHYICTFHGGMDEITSKVENPHFRNVMTPFIKYPFIQGNFPIDIPNHKIYLITSDSNKWVISPNSAGDSFYFSELWLMFSLSFAHGFWLLFYIWLLLFHNRKVFNRTLQK